MTRALHGFGLALRRNSAKVETRLSTFEQWCIVGLVILSLCSAFSVIYLKDLSRRLFIQYQTLQHVQQTNEINQSKLLLEKGAWSTQARIQSIATKQLGMAVPASKNIVMLRQQFSMNKKFPSLGNLE